MRGRSTGSRAIAAGSIRRALGLVILAGGWVGVATVLGGTSGAWAATLHVGPGQAYTTVQAGVDAASPGDTIEIDSGTYTGSAGWARIINGKNNLTLQGVGATRPVLDAAGGAKDYKGILVVYANNLTVLNLELKNTAIGEADGANAAGIRYQPLDPSSPANLIVRNCCFHDNQNGVLTGASQPPDPDILFDSCEFYNNGVTNPDWPDAYGHTHNMYITKTRSFTLQHCYSHNARVGHEVKTRANSNYILYNRITDEGSDASYEIDVPQGGTTYIIGNLIEQSQASQNPTIITYGMECDGPLQPSPTATWNSDQHLYVVNNTVVNSRSSGGTFVVNNSPATNALVQNNIFQGPSDSTAVNGLATAINNWITTNASLVNAAGFDFHLTAASTGAIDQGASPGTGIDGTSLIPTCQYVHPCSYSARPVDTQIDIGAYEFAGPTNPSPANGATNVALNATLSWTGAGSGITFDVYFGTANPPVSKVSSAQSAGTYNPGTLTANTTYYWKIVAINAGGQTAGAVWSFTTVPPPPAAPTNPSPADGATNVVLNATLSWTGAGSGITFDVYFGTANPPVSKVSSAQPAGTYNPGTLAASTTYYWKIVAVNAGGQTAGPVWSFTTVPPLPAAPSNPNPADGAANVALNAVLSWTGAGSGITFDVYFGTANPPVSKVSSAQSAGTYYPGTLTVNTTYYWKIVASNAGGQTPGPVWSFTTLVPGFVYAAGSNIEGQLGVGNTAVAGAALIGNVVQVAAGNSHSLAVKLDGTVWAWGDNEYGQLGDGTTNDSSSPVRVPGLTARVTAGAVAAAEYHSLAVKSDGTVWAWGNNGQGQLGDGTTDQRTSPVQVSGLTGVTAVAAGAVHSLAVKSDGTVWAWGWNEYGELGNDTTSGHLIANPDPIQVLGVTGAIAVAAGCSHSLALKSDGTVWAWGWNYYGQLGNGETSDYDPNPDPVQVLDSTDPTGYLTDVMAVAAGFTHSLAVKSGGTVWAWGSNDYGQLGDGTQTQRNSPVQVMGLTGATVVAGGRFWDSGHSLAAKGDGTVWAWGYNSNGQLGDGTATQSVSPVQVPSLSNLVSVAGGYGHSLAAKSDGTVWGWGYNYSGQLGDETTTNRLSPVQVSSLTGVTAVAAGDAHSLAVKDGEEVWAWGLNNYGQLGDGTTTERHSPVQVLVLTGVTAVAAGGCHSLAVDVGDGTVSAWGYNSNGQLGDETTTNRLNPVQVSSLTGVTAVAAGGEHSLAVKGDGTVWAWGWNGKGQLGDGTTTEHHSPVQVPDSTDPTGYLTGVVAVAAGGEHSLAVKGDGTVWAWGWNGEGELGDGTTTERHSPVQVLGLSNVTGVAAGESHSLFVAGASSGPRVAGTWPPAGTPAALLARGTRPDGIVLTGGTGGELQVHTIVVGFDRAVANVSADDMTLSAGMVAGVEGSGNGPYVFAVTGLPNGTITVTVGGDIAGEDEAVLQPYEWTFENLAPPTAPGNPGQPDGQIDVPISSSLAWSGAAPDVTFDVFLDTVNPPVQQVATGQVAASFTPGSSLAYKTRYYWKVVAHNGVGQTEGPVWYFGTHVQGDITGDGNVNIADVNQIALSWRKSPGDSGYNAAANLTSTPWIDIADLNFLARHWGGASVGRGKEEETRSNGKGRVNRAGECE